jgi:tRNA-dihydrouridine synthase
MSFLKDLPRPFFVLAPMDDVTDMVFRQVVNKCAAAGLYFTEFVNVDGLQSPGRTRLLKKLRFSTAEGPLIAQLWGKDPRNFYETAKQVADGTFAQELGVPAGHNFVGVDLNMGCPQKSEIKSGTCSALINNRPLAEEIIEATKEGLAARLPLSVKTRTGYGSVDLSWHEFLLSKKLDMLTVHGRTKAQMSKVPADWQIIGQVRELRDRLSPDTLIVGNGDVSSRFHGLELAEKHGLDGIMIGRGVFHDPYVFAEDSPWPDLAPIQRLELYENHVRLFAATWQAGERPVQTLNKFCKIYVNGFDGAKELREDMMRAASVEQLLSKISIALTTVKNSAAITLANP